MFLRLLAKIVSYFCPATTDPEGSATQPIPLTCMICAHSTRLSPPDRRQPPPTTRAPGSRVVFIIGAPGTGKGTQSAFLVERYGLRHLSYGDLMRRLRESGDPLVSKLDTKPGTNNPSVPDNFGVWCIWRELDDDDETEGGGAGKEASSWLIDGFPRRVEQVRQWLKLIPPADLTLYLRCPVEVSAMRVAGRGAKAGAGARPEDLDAKVAMRRIEEFYRNADLVVGTLRERGMEVVEVDTNRSEREIQDDLVEIMEPLMKK